MATHTSLFLTVYAGLLVVMPGVPGGLAVCVYVQSTRLGTARLYGFYCVQPRPLVRVLERKDQGGRLFPALLISRGKMLYSTPWEASSGRKRVTRNRATGCDSSVLPKCSGRYRPCNGRRSRGGRDKRTRSGRKIMSGWCKENIGVLLIFHQQVSSIQSSTVNLYGVLRSRLHDDY